MQLIADSWGYVICFNNESEIRELKNSALEGEILLHNSSFPYNTQSGKKLILFLDPNQTVRIKDEYFPKNSSFDNLDKIKITLSYNSYDTLFYSESLLADQPEVKHQILINSAIFPRE